MELRGTTIIGVKKDGRTIIAGDGQATLGEHVIMKSNSKKVRRIFIDKKVPSHIRAMYPVVVNKDNEVIFVPKFYKDLERKSLQSGLFMVQLIYWLI